MKYLCRQDITLDPYQTRTLDTSGSAISIEDASAPFMLSIDGEGEFEITEGYTINQSPDVFRFLQIRNPTASTLTVSLYIGSRYISYSRKSTEATITDAATYTKGTTLSSGALPTIGAGASLTYTGLDGAKQRKEIFFTNGDDTAWLYILDANGKIIAPLPAAQTLAFKSSGAFTLFNPNGAAVSYCVGETFYA